jgi:hypothetical protein
MELREIPRNIGNEYIKIYHYTHKVCTGTKWTLGVIINGEIKGIIQLGTGVQPKATQRWVKGTNMGEWVELNRNWLADDLPHNSESKVMGLMFQWLRVNQPHIKWVVTFANGAAGHVGIQYQASNWIYTGYNKVGGFFVTKEGEMIHPLSLYSKGYSNTKRETLESIYGKPLYRLSGGQFRYFYFIHKGESKNLTLPKLPYPKQRDLENYIEILDANWEGPKPLWNEVSTLIAENQRRGSISPQHSTINTIWW